ncbi:hypothetical protein [Streptomyces corynorhini]|uniref:ABC transporter n=1 Tax=Streptomyces corynorhini TaxID=2282652 RepID=A0A370B5V3_9ACTN|nr:hypothetical protein [Streptomyces corynorhini]RDG36042.1 hypothetical protein DVH02_22155 [Streptomyces corynorhini]
MTDWTTVRRPLYPLAGLATFAGAMALAGETAVHVPSLTPNGTAGIRLMLFAPITVCVALLVCLDRRLPKAELTGVRPVVAADRLLVLATAAAALAAGAAVSELSDAPSALAAGRNALFLTGLALLVRAWGGTTAAGAAAAGWLGLVLVAGFRNAQSPRLWAIVPQPVTDPLAACATALVLVGGVVAMGRRRA